MSDKYVVQLKDAHRHFLQYLLAKHLCARSILTRALILLKADSAGRRADEIARQVQASPSTVYRVRKKFVEEGLQAALFPRERRRPALKVT